MIPRYFVEITHLCLQKHFGYFWRFVFPFNFYCPLVSVHENLCWFWNMTYLPIYLGLFYLFLKVFYFYFLAALCSLWDLSSPTRDQGLNPSEPLTTRSPENSLFLSWHIKINFVGLENILLFITRPFKIFIASKNGNFRKSHFLIIYCCYGNIDFHILILFLTSFWTLLLLTVCIDE